MKVSRAAAATAVAVMTTQLAGCVAADYGFTAFGRLDDTLAIAVVVCRSELREVSIRIDRADGPDATEDSQALPDEDRGAWRPVDGGRGVKILDVASPGSSWDVVDPLPAFAPGSSAIRVDARGQDNNGNFSPIRFTLADFDSLGEDEWTYAPANSQAGRKTTDDLTATAETYCS